MRTRTFCIAAGASAAFIALAPALSEARPGGAVRIGGHVGVGGPAFSGGGHRGGWYGPRYGGGYSGYRGHTGYGGWRGYGGYRGYSGYRGYGHRGYWGPGPFWGGLGIGIGLGAIGGYYGSTYVYDAPPAYIVSPGYAEYGTVDPIVGDDVVVRSGRASLAAAPPAEPIFYPKEGQSPDRIEADRRDCNRWATTQPSAMAVASVFQRATLACMEGRGYSVK